MKPLRLLKMRVKGTNSIKWVKQNSDQLEYKLNNYGILIIYLIFNYVINY